MNRPDCVLFDLDHTLVHYDHAVRVRALAERCGADPERVSVQSTSASWLMLTSGSLHGRVLTLPGPG